MTLGKFGRYEIKEEIGRGGMATVFHAYDPRFERDVAIKVLPREFLHDPQFHTRFEREAKTIALLEHPAIVPVYDFGEEDGQPYIVMRYMSGGSLADRMAKGALSVDEACQILSRLAPALDVAHAKGIIHRDLKPANILFDQYGNACLSDFGIARLIQASSATLTGENILGTPAYMSPEQVQGNKDIDGRSDLYAFGVILYQMLTGKTPYQSDTPARVMMMHVLDPVPSVLEFKVDLLPSFETVIKKILAKDPEERFATAGEFAQAAEAAASDATLPSFYSAAATMISPGGIALSREGRTPPPGTLPGSTAIRTGPRKLPAWLWVAFGLGMFGLVGLLVAGGAWLVFSGLPSKPALTDTPSLSVIASNTQPSMELTHTPPMVANTPTPVPLPTETQALLVVEAPTATPTIAPTTAIQATTTPSATPEVTLAAPVIGGADKLAFVNANDIWVVNLDGSDLKQLTNDGSVKSHLQWAPGGEYVIFITGKCAKSVSLDTGRVDFLACFDTAAYLEAFEISPDGQNVAISLDHEHLYIVPYDLETLSQVRFRRDLAPLGTCATFAPYDRLLVKSVRWSRDGTKLGIVFAAPVAGKREDTIRVIDVSNCVENPPRLDEFPGQWFRISGYDANPTILNFGWDGDYLFALTGIIRNAGFGDLYLYNTALHRAELKVNPINGTCCYRDPQWSPDGRYLAFAYQEFSEENKIYLYYIPFGTIGTGETYQPIPLPDNFFTNRTESPQPALRLFTTSP